MVGRLGDDEFGVIFNMDVKQAFSLASDFIQHVSSTEFCLNDKKYRIGASVGLTTSGGQGPRTGLTLAFGMIDIAPDETLDQTCARDFQIEVAGETYQATPLKAPPFDPTGIRMRG